MPPRRLAIVCTHPIQYNVPVFRSLSNSDGIEMRVFYTWSQAAVDGIFDSGFGADIKWDIPLLDGYAYQFVPNVASRPGPEHFQGLKTPTLIREIEHWAPDVILVYSWCWQSHLQVIRHFKGLVSVLFRGDSTLLDARPWWKGVARRVLLTWVYRHIDVAIAVGTNNQKYFSWCGVPSTHIALVPHSVDTGRFAADDDRKHERQAVQWRSALGIPEAAVVILFAGKLQAKKNPFLLLDAFGSLKSSSHLVLVGNGELERELKAKAASMQNVHFMPFRNQSIMPAVYRLGDIFVLPSQGPEETWGLAMNEAMACGRAVIASDKVGGACDLISPGETGWIFESGNLAELQNLLLKADASGRPGLHDMGRVAQALSVRWSSEESARGIEEVVLSCPAVNSRRR